MQDQQLVLELKNGDQKAFKALVKAYKNRVYNTCLGFLRNPQDAEDLTQDVFVLIYHTIENFKEESELSTWIYKIAVNKSLELTRYRKRQKRSGFFKALMNNDESLHKIEDSDKYAHPGVRLENKERAKLLMNAIEELPEDQRTAFVLHKMEGMEYKKVAAVMEKSLSAVESLIYRGKVKLRKKLSDYYYSN